MVKSPNKKDLIMTRSGRVLHATAALPCFAYSMGHCKEQETDCYEHKRAVPYGKCVEKDLGEREAWTGDLPCLIRWAKPYEEER